MDNLASLSVFLAVAETLSFAEAARRLGLSPSATGKAVGRLEARLRVRLFHRTTRRVSLTEEGALLLTRGRRIRGELLDIEAVLSQRAAAPEGRLRVGLPAIGHRFLAPHLADFAQIYPGIRLDLDLSDGIADLADGGIDVVIRSGVLPDSALMTRRLGGFRFLLYAAPAYLAAHGSPDGIVALAEHAQVRFRHPGTEILQAWALPTPMPSCPAPAITCTNMEAVLAVAIAGFGIAWMPEFLATDAVARGDLTIVLEESTATEGTFWLVWLASRQPSSRLRAFIDFAAGRLFVA